MRKIVLNLTGLLVLLAVIGSFSLPVNAQGGPTLVFASNPPDDALLEWEINSNTNGTNDGWHDQVWPVSPALLIVIPRNGESLFSKGEFESYTSDAAESIAYQLSLEKIDRCVVANALKLLVSTQRPRPNSVVPLLNSLRNSQLSTVGSIAAKLCTSTAT